MEKSELLFKLLSVCPQSSLLSAEMSEIWIKKDENPLELQGSIFMQEELDFSERPSLFEIEASWQKI